MSKSKQGYELIPLLDMAAKWYRSHDVAPLPCPSCVFNPDDIGEIDVKNEDTYALFYTKSSNCSRLSDSGTILTNLSTHILPLLAGVQLEMSTEQLAQIVTDHNITVDDYEDMIIATHSAGDTLFSDQAGNSVSFTDAKIETWKAFEALGMIEARQHAPGSSNYAAMHTQCEGAWPSTILREIASGNLADDSGDSDLLLSNTTIVGKWTLSKASHFPGNNALTFLRRSGMLVSAGYRKQLAYHHQWEDLCLAANEAGGHLGLRALLSCKDLDQEERRAARNALRSMHPERGTDHVDMSRIFSFAEIWFRGTDLDISDSTILKINLSEARKNEAIERYDMERQPETYADILQEPQQTLQKVCQEILALDPSEIGFAHLDVFRGLKRLRLGSQVIQGLRPEDVILKLEAGLKDFIGKRTQPNSMSQRMYSGMSDAFELFGSHAWDYQAFKNCSEQTVLTLVRGGAAMGKLPDMGRKRRGQFLEDELGL